MGLSGSYPTVDAETEKRYLLDQIKQHTDPSLQEVMSGVIPTGLKVYGLRTTLLRQIAGAWERAHKRVAREDLLVLVEAMWHGESREERIVALELLRPYPRWIADLTWAHFERWRLGLDNWELTDALGISILGPWLLGDPDTRLGHLKDLIAEEDVWSRRLALVSTVGLNRAGKGTTFPTVTLDLIDQVKEQRHPTITKAISWTLRVMIKKHPKEVAAYLDDNRGALATHVVREVSNKLKTGRKCGKAKSWRHQKRREA
jgi:3-methyladenine DNA glycosylase AlkD